MTHLLGLGAPLIVALVAAPVQAQWLNEAGGNIYGDSRVNPMADPRVNPMADPRVNPNADPRVNPYADPRVNPNADIRVSPCGTFGC